MLRLGVVWPLPPLFLDHEKLTPIVQKWTSGLLGIFGAVVLVGSRESLPVTDLSPGFFWEQLAIVGLISDGGTSRKSAYTFGLACLVGGISALAITDQLFMLVVSRILQGISAAGMSKILTQVGPGLIEQVVFTVGLAIVADSVEPRDIGYYMGYVLSSMSCGVLMGPFFGSVAFNFAGQFAVVGLMALTALVDIILRVFMIEKSEAEEYESCHVTERSRLLSSCNAPSPATSAKWRMLKLLANPRVATAIYGVFVQWVTSGEPTVSRLTRSFFPPPPS